MGLHKEVRLEPTISFNSKWFVCNGTQQMHSACPATLNVIGYANKCKHLGILWNWVRSLDCNSKCIGFAVSFCIEYLYKPASCYDTLSLTSCCFRGEVQCKIQYVFLAIICDTVSQEISAIEPNSLITFSFSSKSNSLHLSGRTVSQSWFDVCIWSGFSRCQNFQFYFIRITNDTPHHHPPLEICSALVFLGEQHHSAPSWWQMGRHLVSQPSLCFWVTFIKALGAVWSLCTFYFNHVSMSETSPDCIFLLL